MILKGSSPDGVGAASYVASPDGALVGHSGSSVLALGQSHQTGVVTFPQPAGILEGRLNPGLGSLLSLPGVYVTGGGGGSGPATRPQIFHIDDYGADPSGSANSNQALIDVYAALGGSPGVIVFGVGTYKFFLGLNEAAGRLLKPGQGVVGQGSGLTYIDYRGPGAFLEFRDRDFDNYAVSHQHGGLHGMTILGWSSGENDSCGVRYGDIMKVRISDLEINGFNRPGCKGLWGDNQYRFSERAFIEANVNQCTECYVFESNTGSSTYGSFDYSQYWLSFVIQPNQHGFVLRSGSSGSKVSMNGAELTLTGNCQLGAVGTTNNGVMFTCGKDNNDQASFSGTLRIGVETSGTPGGSPHYDFMQGAGPSYLIKSRVSASGTINLIPFSGTNFKYGSASSKTFAFGGMLKGSPSLGSTGTVQSFQSLQLLSQAKGDWYIDQTNAVQTVYVTQATGGTFTLSFGGQTTSAIPYNASVSQVQTALNALSSIAGAVTVYHAQARYINSLPVDEIAFTVVFGGALVATTVALITANATGLTGTGHAVTVVEKVPGSPNTTYVFGLESGSIFYVEPSPGTYRMRFTSGGLTALPVGQFGESPFGVNSVDVWVKQPDTGGAAVFEGPFFVPETLAGSSYSFRWMDGQEPIFSTVPSAVDIVRLTSHNFGVWVGQHITRQATTTVPVPATATSPGIKGQISYDSAYIYTCVAANTWKRSPLSTW